MQKDLETAEQPLLNGSQRNLVTFPPLRLTRRIPETLDLKEIENAVKEFQKETPIHGNEIGFYNQTLESIAASTMLRKEGSGSDFWIVQYGRSCAGYVLANMSKDVDNQLCYWISQCWLDKRFRGTGVVKEYWKTLVDYAKKNLCKHVIIVSGRGDRSYQRLLGSGLEVYATLIKADI